MNSHKFVASAAALLLSSSAFAINNAPYAAEVQTRNGAKLLSLNFESAGDVSAFTFRVVLPDDAKAIDTSNCLSELPKGFTGVCKAYGNVVAVTAYSSNIKALPAGLVTVGKLSYRSSLAKAQAQIDSFEASTPESEEARVSAPKVEKLD